MSRMNFSHKMENQFHAHRNHLVPNYPKKILLSPQIQLYNEQKLEIFHDSDNLDLLQNGSYTSIDTSEIEDEFSTLAHSVMILISNQSHLLLIYKTLQSWIIIIILLPIKI